jgi:NADH-quinone oxidoreductase subunit J
MTSLFFFYFAGVIVLTGILVIALRNPMYSAISLLVMFFHIAGIYVLLNAEFIAVIQILVYAGAILVLYLFVVMLLNLKGEEKFHNQLLLGLFLGLVIFAEVSLVFFRTQFKGIPGEYTVERVKQMGNTEAVGQVLYTVYLFPFEVASLILLVAMVGAIVLTKKGLMGKD